MNLKNIYRFIEFIKVVLENFVFASKYFYNTNTKVVSFEINGKELVNHLDITADTDISSYIEIAKNANLEFYDSFIADNDDFWINTVSDYGKILRTTMKLAWLTQSINEDGLSNPIQLLQTSSGKYICHPGSGRILVLAHILPKKKIKCFYVWEESLDKNPFFLQYPYKIINNSFSFLSMFKKSYKHRVKTCILKSEDNISSGYFKYAFCALKKAHPKFSLNFITTSDDGYLYNNIKGKLFFRDLVQFKDDTHCIFGGIHMIKSNNLWKPE